MNTLTIYFLDKTTQVFDNISMPESSIIPVGHATLMRFLDSLGHNWTVNFDAIQAFDYVEYEEEQ